MALNAAMPPGASVGLLNSLTGLVLAHTVRGGLVRFGSNKTFLAVSAGGCLGSDTDAMQKGRMRIVTLPAC